MRCNCDRTILCSVFCVYIKKKKRLHVFRRHMGAIKIIANFNEILWYCILGAMFNLIREYNVVTTVEIKQNTTYLLLLLPFQMYFYHRIGTFHHCIDLYNIYMIGVVFEFFFRYLRFNLTYFTSYNTRVLLNMNYNK